jgi:hypothetical protein
MSMRVKVQRVDREKSRSFYVNLPVVLAEALAVKKGESFDWSLEDKNTLVFTRTKPQPARKRKSTSP